jgi:hypothetical protein
MCDAKERLAIVQLRGGLGNQIFQYALGAAICARDGRQLILDDIALRTTPGSVTPRAYYLGAFRVQARLTSENGVPVQPVLARVIQSGRGFHPEVLEHSCFGALHLQGFWQDERYFGAIAETIRTCFETQPDWSDGHWAPIIRTVESVAVHIRRQDYVTKRGRLELLCNEYYERAFIHMGTIAPAPHFFVFSDDIDWCKQHVSIDRPHSFVDHDAHKDNTILHFRLMSLCRHFIIANSTFSWWAAWLSRRAGRIIAPLNWFADTTADSRDIVPAAWTRI